MIGPWRLSKSIKPEACKACPRFAKGKGFVPCDGPPDANILVIGRHPGPAEGATGRPYSGGAGSLFDSLLSRAGLDRRHLLVTNLVKCAGPDPTHEEIVYCQSQYLVEELPGRRCIVTLGSLPGKYIAGIEKIRHERGTVHMLAGTPVVVTLEPAGLLWSKSEAKNLGETRDFLPIVIKDLAKAKRIAAGSPNVTQDRVLVTNPTSTDVDNMLERIDKTKKVTTDIETSFHDDGGRNITYIGIAAEPGYAISMKHWRHHFDKLDKMYRRTDILNINHNIQFDPNVMEEEGGFKMLGPRYDTMLADHLIESDMGDFGLELVCSRHLDYEPWKHLHRGDPAYWAQRNVNDVAMTAELEKVLTPRMQELGVEGLFYKHQIPMARICYKMKKSGIRVDEERMMKLSIACTRIADRHEKTMEGMFGILFNPRSPNQLKEVLYEKLKLPVQLHRRTRKVTTDHYALEDLQKYIAENQCDSRAAPFLEALLDCRRYGKLANTFARGEHVVDGRVHPDYLQHRAVTGRQSSQNPNMHQQPAGVVREIYVPDTDDDIFIEADYKQIEMRLAAWFARCEKMLAMFKADVDIHLENAKRFYGAFEVTKTQRSLAKNMFYGIMYGQTKRGLAVMYGVTEEYAETFINFIFGEYPELKRWRNGLLNTVEEENLLRNPYGRIRWLWNRQFATEAFICLPQSTGYDVLAEAAIELDERLPPPARIFLMVHDSIGVHCPAVMRDEVSSLIRECMERPREALNGFSIPIKMGAGTNYDQASHEEGLAGDWRRLRRTVR